MEWVKVLWFKITGSSISICNFTLLEKNTSILIIMFLEAEKSCFVVDIWNFW